MSERLNDARAQLAKADFYFQVSKFIFIVYIVIVTTVLLVQLFGIQQGQAEQLETAQDGLTKSLAENEVQHQKTQNYIKCIASALLTPLAQRSIAVFDQCGIAADEAQASTTPVNAIVPTDPDTEQTSPQPTTSSPPDPVPEPGTQSSVVGNPSVLRQVTAIVLSPLELILKGGDS